MDAEIRSKEIAKLKKMNLSRQQLKSTLRSKNKTGHKSILKDAQALDINLDLAYDMISPGNQPALGEVLNDLNLAMVDTPGRPSSKVEDLDDKDSLEDSSAAAYLQRVYTIGNRYPRHPLVATFTLSPIADGTVFNPFSHTPPREEEQIEPEIDYTMFLGESWSTVDDTAHLPFYTDEIQDRRKRRVTELGQLPVMQFNWSEDAKAIYKYGIGIQWSFETAFREARMQLLGTWVMRQAITDRIWLLMDLLGTAIDFAVEKDREYDIPADGASETWTWDKLDDYNYRWRVPYLYDCLVGRPGAITKFKKTDWGSDNWTLGHMVMMGSFFNMNYEDMRMSRKVKFVDLPELEGIEMKADKSGPKNEFDDTKYLFMKKSAGIGQVWNTGMTRDRMTTNESNQSFTRYFSMGTRFYGIHPKAVEVATLK